MKGTTAVVTAKGGFLKDFATTDNSKTSERRTLYRSEVTVKFIRWFVVELVGEQLGNYTKVDPRKAGIVRLIVPS